MVKCRIYLVDSDLTYLAPIEYALVRRFKNNVDIKTVSEENFFDDRKGKPIKAELLVVNENLANKIKEIVQAEEILVLTENAVPSIEEIENLPHIYKYTSLENIWKTVEGIVERFTSKGESNGTKWITVYSPQGGSGKTTMALGLAGALSELGRKVIYIDAETMQDFGELVGIENHIGNELLHEMRDKRVSYDTIMRNVHSGVFDALLPLRYSLASCGLSESSYFEVINVLRLRNEYDYIVMDTSSSFDEEKARLLGRSNSVVVPVLQNNVGRRKLQAMGWNMDISDEEKFLFVINSFEADKKNEIAGPDVPSIGETIPRISEEILENIETIKKSGVFSELAFRFL